MVGSNRSTRCVKRLVRSAVSAFPSPKWQKRRLWRYVAILTSPLAICRKAIRRSKKVRGRFERKISYANDFCNIVLSRFNDAPCCFESVIALLCSRRKWQGRRAREGDLPVKPMTQRRHRAPRAPATYVENTRCRRMRSNTAHHVHGLFAWYSTIIPSINFFAVTSINPACSSLAMNSGALRKRAADSVK